MTPLSPEELARDLAIRDLTDPAAGPHAIQLITDRAVRALEARWHCQVRRCRGPRIVPVADNYDRLGYRPDAITRDARYTRYVDESRMLRSHATAMIPPALRELALRELAIGPPAPDVLLACPGLVYRRDAIDRLRTGTPHQLDLWRITTTPMTPRDLREMIQIVLDAVLPGAEYRLEARRHPYTTDGVQVDVRSGADRDGADRDGADWVEVGEGGLAAAAVLHGAGLDRARQRGASGLALGLGLDRLLMLATDIPDIRLLLTGPEANRLRDRIYAAIHQGSAHQWAAQ